MKRIQINSVQPGDILFTARPGKVSKTIRAGLLLFRLGRDGPEVLLAHPGGPSGDGETARVRSGRSQQFPEIDRAAWFALDVAHQKILNGQAAFLDRLEVALAEEE